MTTLQQPAENLAWYALSAEAAAGQMGVDPGQGLDAEKRSGDWPITGRTSCRPSRRRTCGR